MAVEYQVEVNYDGRATGDNLLLLDGSDTTDVVSVRTKLGRSNNAFLYGQTVAGRATVVLRDAITERKYDPLNSESELFGRLEPNQPIRFRFLRSDGNWRPFWHGYIDDVKYKNGRAFNTVTIKCMGEIERLQQSISISRQSGKTIGDLMKLVMDAADADYSSGATDYEGGATIVQYIAENVKALDELRRLETSDGGIIFEQRFGNIARRKTEEYNEPQIPAAHVMLDTTAPSGARLNALRTLPANAHRFNAVGAELDFSRRSIANSITIRSTRYAPSETVSTFDAGEYTVTDDQRGEPFRRFYLWRQVGTFAGLREVRGRLVNISWGYDIEYRPVQPRNTAGVDWSYLFTPLYYAGGSREFYNAPILGGQVSSSFSRSTVDASDGRDYVHMYAPALVFAIDGTDGRRLDDSGAYYNGPAASARLWLPGVSAGTATHDITLNFHRYTQQTSTISVSDQPSIDTYGLRKANIQGIDLSASIMNTLLQRYRKPQALYAVSVLVEDNTFNWDLNIDDRVRVWGKGSFLGDYRITSIENDISQGAVHIVKWELSPSPEWTPIDTLSVSPDLPSSVSASQATTQLLRTTRTFSITWDDGLNDPRYYGGQSGYLPTAYMKVDAELLDSDGQRRGNLVSLVNQGAGDATAQPLGGLYTSSTSKNFPLLPAAGNSVRFILTLYDSSGSDIEIRTAGEVSIT